MDSITVDYGSETLTNGTINQGYGWTHNYRIHATVVSDTERAFGADKAEDAHATVAALYYANKFSQNMSTTRDHITVAFVAAWLDDELTDNAVSVSQGANQSTFVRKPGLGGVDKEANFLSPRGSIATLRQMGERAASSAVDYAWSYRGFTFDLKNADNSTMHFSFDGEIARFAPMRSWTFPSGVVVTIEANSIHSVNLKNLWK